MADCQRVLPQLGISLAGAAGTGQSLLASDAVIFNGAGGNAHETLAVYLIESDRGDGRPVFSFCKTAHKPYDLAVQITLIIFHHHLGDIFHVSSDGADAEWATARQLCHHHLGYGEDFRLARN